MFGKKRVKTWGLVIGLCCLISPSNAQSAKDIKLNDGTPRPPLNSDEENQKFRGILFTAILQGEKGKFKEALTTLGMAEKLSRDHPLLIQKKAEWLEELGKWPEALSTWQGLIQLDPNASAGHIGVARAQKELRNYFEAGLALVKLKDWLNPGVQFLVLKGEIFLGLNELEIAGENFLQALVLDPNNPAAQAGMGGVYLEYLDFQSALPFFEAVKNHPIYGPKTIEKLLLAQHKVDPPIGWEKALDSFINKNPKSRQGLSLLAARYAKSGETKLAIETASRKIELYPNNTTALLERSNLYTHHGEKELALKDIDKAISIDPDNRGLFHQKSYIYSYFGDFSLAKKYCEKAFKGSSSELYPGLDCRELIKGIPK